MHARALVGGRESDHAEVTGLSRRGDVIPSEGSPPKQILGGDQDPAVRPRATAGAASQAVELFAHAMIMAFSEARARAVW